MRLVRRVHRAFRVIIGIPVEIFNRVTGRRHELTETVTYSDPEGWTLTALKGMKYDYFTFAPDLRQLNGRYSNACAVHDWGWESGKKDDGNILTFDENNRAFRAVMDQEDHPDWIKNLYEWGVSLSFMRKRWRNKFCHE